MKLNKLLKYINFGNKKLIFKELLKGEFSKESKINVIKNSKTKEITFYLDTSDDIITYTALEGMTWEQFINTDYVIDAGWMTVYFEILGDAGYIWAGSHFNVGGDNVTYEDNSFVMASHKLIDGYTYHSEVNSGQE